MKQIRLPIADVVATLTSMQLGTTWAQVVEKYGLFEYKAGDEEEQNQN